MQSYGLGLLGIIEDEHMGTNMRTLLRPIFFCVRKFIAIHWIRTDYLTLSAWKSLVNSNVTLYRMTYDARGCSKKFTRIWAGWVESMETVSDSP